MLDANQSKFDLDVTTVDMPLQVYEFTGDEKIGEGYQFDITFICEEPDLILEEWLQLPARLSINGDNANSDANTRFVHGVIQSMEQINTSFRFSTYRLSLVPVFSLLSLRHNYQIFQHKPVHDIISEMYSKAGILNHHYEIELHYAHENRDYCVQYGETDAQFVQRLMAEEGLISYFEHTESQSKLIISDGKETHTNLPELEFMPENGMAQESDVIYSLAKEQNIQTGKYSIKDYAFHQPKQIIKAEKSSEQKENTASEEALEHYDYQALEQANLYLESKRTNQTILRGESDSPQLTPGYFQPISNHPIEEWNTNWLITSVNYEGRQPQVLEEFTEGTSHFESRFQCIPWSVPYRLAQIDKPRIHNIDTAMVTGPENEEIYCDEHGRVKVQFHWDRNGQADEKTSCWLRTSQGWAGNQYGQFVLPRIGHEVIVSFIQGDPDKPIITGSLYNGDNKPPYTLPEHKTRSTFKTSSSIGADNFNELRFEDKKASEQIYIHAAKDMDSQIQNNRTSEIFNDDHSVVHHDQFHQVTKDNHLTVQSDNLSSIKGDAHQQVSGSIQQKIQGSRLEQIGTEFHIKVGNKAVLDAGSELTITTGSSTMKLDSGGIHLLGAAIDLNKGGSAGSGSGYAGITATQPIMKQSEMAGSVAESATVSEYTRSKIHAIRQIEALKNIGSNLRGMRARSGARVMETECFDSLNIDDFSSFYLMIDTSQEGDVLKQLYRLDTAVEQEPLYLYEPWDDMISVSPYLVKATPVIAQWFESQLDQLDGFLFSSPLELESLAEHLRSVIKVQSPYGSSIILKSAHSGCANVLFSTGTDWYWQHIDEVWLPYKKGWAHYLSPCTEMKSIKPYRLTDEQWQALGELATENAYAYVLNHVEYFFPHCLEGVIDKQKWIQYWFDAAYSRGFQDETEVCFFMNVMGYLGKEAITTDKYPKITELIYQTSQQTPEQRIKQAADLAYQYRHSMQKGFTRMSEANNAAMCGSKKDAKNPVGACPVKFGVIDIIPVRYAIDDMDDEEKEQIHPLLDTHKGHGFFDVAHSKYTLRQLRDGWLYVYSNRDKTFHEYQVKGTQFIKIDWGSNEADKAPEERGQAGEAKSCLSYSKNDTLTISFSHQRWTWRLCEHMRSNTQCRNEWMRTVDLKTYSNTLEIEHGGGMRDFVHAVADIGTSKPSDILFEKTCSPLKADDSSDDEFHLATYKKPVLETDYQCDLLEKNSALYIALDDQLADITDLFLKLSREMAEKAAIMGDEDKQYKLQMAELTRTLGRVRLDENELPKEIRGDPISIFQFEKELTDYLYIQGLAYEEQALPAAESVHYEPVYTPQAKVKLQELKNNYSYEPDSKLLKKFKETTAYTSDVNWEELDEFVTSHYSQLKGTSERINNYLSDFIAAVTQLGIDPLILGLDNQYENHQAYLLNLVSQFLIVVKQVPELEEQMKLLDELLSFDSPNNLLALAPVGFSLDNWEALNDHINEGGKPLIDPFSAGDMDAFWSRFSEWDSFTGDARIQEKAWFQSLVLPIQKSFAALEGAVKNQVGTSWRAMMDLLFPSQWKKGASSINVVSNLRLIFLESMMTDSAIVEVNKSYKTQRATFLNKLNVHIEALKKATKSVPGQSASKNHQIKSTQAIQQRIQQVLSSEMPTVLALKNSAVNAQAKQLVNNYVDTVWTQTKEITDQKWKSLGKWGGVLAALNMWELAVVTKDVNYKAEQAGDTFYEQFKPVWREVAHASAYVVANISALFRDKAWGEIEGDDRLLKRSLKQVFSKRSNQSNITINEREFIKTFAKHALITATFGLIATGLEAWESFDKAMDRNKRVDERFGYWLKFGALTGQFIVFLAQGALTLLSRFGVRSISSILAPWMLSSLMVTGVLYLIATIIIKIFTRTELQNWLYESCWGKGDLKWEKTEAVSRLESILYKPQLSLKKIIGRKPTHSQDPGSMQWQLIVDLPSFTENKYIELKVKRIPYTPTFQYGFKAPEKLEPIVVNEQTGQWIQENNDSPCYVITMGGTIKDSVEVKLKMPFKWLNSNIKSDIYYLARGSNEGGIVVKIVNETKACDDTVNKLLVPGDKDHA